MTALGSAEQSRERPAIRGVVDGTPYTTRLRQSGPEEKRAAGFSRFARRGVNDQEVTLGQ